MNHKKSKALFARALKALAGGVNSPVRAFGGVGGTPIFFEKGKGATVTDVDGNTYIDYVQSWGPLVLGHAPKSVARAIAKQGARGTSFGAPTALETELAETLKRFFPSCERLRLTSSGTEAVMTAIRLARGATKRSKIIKFEGCYHGHSDSLLVKAGSGLATLGRPTSLGVPPELAKQTIVLPFNDRKALVAAFKKHKDIAAAIIEPIAGNMGLVPADPEFLSTLRRLTTQSGTILIFDEVITAFRAAPGGAQSLYGITPDLTTLGKVIGGGLPIGAVGGPARLFKYLSPDGGVYQAGTLSGNPISVTAGLATIHELTKNGGFAQLLQDTAIFVRDLREVFRKNKIECVVPWVGSMFCIYFQKEAPSSFKEITLNHVKTYRKFFRHMLESGVYLAPSAYEVFFVSTAHKRRDFDKTLAAVATFKV